MSCCLCCGTVRCKLIRFVIGIVLVVAYIPAVFVTIKIKNYEAAIGFGAVIVTLVFHTYFLWKLFGRGIKEAIQRKRGGLSDDAGMMIYPVNKTSGFEAGDHTDMSPLMEMSFVDLDSWPMRSKNTILVTTLIFALFSLALGVYYLVMGAFIDKQTWNADSYFLPMVGWLNTLKWCYINIRLFRNINQEEGEY